MAMPPTHYVLDLGPQAQTMYTNCANERIAMALQYVALGLVMKRYESAGLQLAHAALAHLAERKNIRTVFRTDRRDFSHHSLKRNRALNSIPNVDLPLFPTPYSSRRVSPHHHQLAEFGAAHTRKALRRFRPILYAPA
jgi:hypothetical protein